MKKQGILLFFSGLRANNVPVSDKITFLGNFNKNNQSSNKNAKLCATFAIFPKSLCFAFMKYHLFLRKTNTTCVLLQRDFSAI